VAESREPDPAARYAAVCAEIDAELAQELSEIDSTYQASREEHERWGPDALAWFEAVGGPIPSPEETRAEWRRRRDEARQRAERRKREAREEFDAALRVPPQVAPNESNADPDEPNDLVGGDPYAKADYEAAARLYKAGKMTVAGIAKHDLSTRRAHRLYRQFEAGAVVVNDVGVVPGAGYRWDSAWLDHDPQRYKLIRG
jgi:hypothetical protein